MQLYETIFKRRSVRSFINKPLSGEILNNIQNRLDNLKQLDGQKATFKIVSGEAVKNTKAPHYILAYSDGGAAYINVGYCLQEMDLYIQSMGLGSLWLGMAKPKEKQAENKSSDFCIMLAFGGTDVPQRNGEKDFNRLELKEISDTNNDIIRAARLAPSAMNSQPWHLDFDNEKVVIKYRGRGLLKSVLKNKLSKIDIGIITKHTETALKNSGKTDISVLPQVNNKTFSVSIFYK